MLTPALHEVRYDVRMKLGRRRALMDRLEEKLQRSIAEIPAAMRAVLPNDDSRLHRIATAAVWVAGGMGVVTLGLLAGRELRGRYKVKRRSPYDYYAHAGDQTSGLDFGVGI